MMLKMKKVILLFAMTMKSYGFGIGSLYTLLQNFRYFMVFFLTKFFLEIEHANERELVSFVFLC